MLGLHFTPACVLLSVCSLHLHTVCNFPLLRSLQSAVRSPQSAVRSLSFTLTEIKKAHNLPSSSLSVPWLWSLYKKPFERTANNTLPQKLENHGITSSSLCWIILRVTVLLRTLYLGTGLVLSSLSQAFWLSNMWTYALTEKVSNILRTSVKFSKNPLGKKLQNCFIHKSSTGSGHLVPDLGIGGLGLQFVSITTSQFAY